MGFRNRICYKKFRKKTKITNSFNICDNRLQKQIGYYFIR